MESNNQNSQEIDLSYLSKKTGNFFDSLGYTIFKFFRFLVKNIILLAILVALGAIAGYFWDKRKGSIYKHEIIVVPNFNSNSYLYNKVQNLSLKNSSVKSVKIEPVMDVYQFITEGWNNLEVAKYLSENNIQFTKYEPNSDVEKMYRYHLMTIETDKFDKNGKVVDSLLNEFNKDPYYLSRQKIEQANTQILIDELNKSRTDVDKILDKIGTGGTATSNLNIEMYSELNTLINSKKAFVMESSRLEINKLEQSKIIYASSKLLNIKKNKVSNIIIFPILLVVCFIGFSILLGFYKRYNQVEKGEI